MVGRGLCPFWALSSRLTVYRTSAAHFQRIGEWRWSAQGVLIVVSFREGEAPAEPYTTEKIATERWLGRRLTFLERRRRLALPGAAAVSRRDRVPRARRGSGGARLEGLGHANGESQSTGWSLAKLGSVVARQSSPVAAGSAQTAGRPPAVGAPARRQVARDDLKKRISTAAIAFRGYDVTNLGRGPELLEHPVYGPIVRATLDSASALCSDVLGKKVDLAARVLRT